MKAASYHRYGGPEELRITDMPRPVPKPHEVLVKVSASSVTTADWRMRASAFPGITWLPGRLMVGLFRPRRKVLGMEFAGTVEAIGDKVTRFRPGQRVFGASFCGSNAEYLAVSEMSAIYPTPDALPDDEAAALPFGAITALIFLRDFAQVRPGQKVLILGASGGVGVYAVQIARHLGAEVTGVASARNLALVRDLGAHHTIDYEREDFTRGSARYDVILDTIGVTSFTRCKGVLTDRGRFLPLNLGLCDPIEALVARLTGGKRLLIRVNGSKAEDLAVLCDLIAKGDLRAVIDRHYDLSEIVEAHRYVEARHRRGSVVIRVA